MKLALEAETAITQLLILDHEYYRKQVADSTETPHAPDEPHSFLQYKLTKTKIKIHKTNLKNNEAIIKKADKGNSTVTLYNKIFLYNTTTQKYKTL